MATNLKKISDKLEEISDMLDDLRELTSNSILRHAPQAVNELDQLNPDYGRYVWLAGKRYN